VVIVTVVSLIVVGASCLLVVGCIAQDVRCERKAQAILLTYRLHSAVSGNDSVAGARRS